MRTKRTYADALNRAEQKLSQDELENSRTLNPKLRIIPTHPNAPALQSILGAMVATLEEGKVPPGFRRPIASGPMRERMSWRTAETLLANLLYLSKGDKDTLSLTLQHAAYKGTALTGTGLVNLVKLGHNRELWQLYKGFRTRTASRLARVYPRRKFHHLVASVLAEGVAERDSFYSHPEQLIFLRNEMGEDVPAQLWRPTPEEALRLEVLQSCLRWFNVVLGEYKIKTINRVVYPVLYARFKPDFAHGGRFYTGLGGHSNLPKQERRTITFDGHPTIELDFQGFHLRMLYHLAGSSFPLDADPYAQVLEVLGLSASGIFKDFPSIREDLKDMLLAFINDTATLPQQIARANRRLFYGKTQRKQDAANQRIKRWREAGLLQTQEPTAAPVLAAFHKAHQPIAAQFATGCGTRLQNIDSEITRWVLMEMMVSQADECVPTLPIHDSFVTFAEYQQKLETAMQDVYQFVMRQQTGQHLDFQIPVEKR